MDNLQKVAFNDNFHTNETSKRIITSVLDKYVNELRVQPTSYTPARIEAIRNSLFLKYTCIEFESIFQSIYKDKKIDG